MENSKNLILLTSTVLAHLLFKRRVSKLLLILCFSTIGTNVKALQLFVGASSVDITLPLPVALSGQSYLRIAHEVQTPVTANILLIQNERETPTIWIACDLVAISEELREAVLEKIKLMVSSLDTKKIIISAIHTHTAPVVTKNKYLIPEGVTTVEQSITFISGQIAQGVHKAWEGRQAAKVAWGMGHASVATNRRATYVDGTHIMYGDTHLSEFRGLEWASPDELDVLFFWNKKGKLIAAAIDVPCPAQVVEGRRAVNADYWHVVRENLKKYFSDQLVIIGWIGAAGDQSPHPMVDGPAERRMQELQSIDRLHQLGNRISREVTRVYEIVKADTHGNIKLVHETRILQLPRRPITHQTYLTAKDAVDKIKSADEKTRTERYRHMLFEQAVIDRYEEQQKNPQQEFKTAVHVIRLGDVAICTSQFELFHSFGERIKARSKALQTFNIQLAGQGTYLPTRSALLGGGYSATSESNIVGPIGGQILVDKTVELINTMFREDMHNKQR